MQLWNNDESTGLAEKPQSTTREDSLEGLKSVVEKRIPNQKEKRCDHFEAMLMIAIVILNRSKKEDRDRTG